MLDTISYISNAGTVNLRSPTVRSNPKAAKAFGFTAENGSIYESEKEFTLTLVIVGNANANDVIDKLLSDYENDKYGTMIINGWNLRCCCIAVPSVIEDEWGVLQLTATFHAPRILWYKRPNIGTPIASGSSIILPSKCNVDFSAEWGTAQSHEITIGNEGIYHLEIDPGTPSPSADAFFFSEAVEKKIILDGEDALKFVPDDIDVFKKIPAGTYTITHDFELLAYRLVEWRVMPRWLTI